MRRRGMNTKKKAGSAPSIPFVQRVQTASDPEQIMAAVDKLQEGIMAVKALEDTFELCKKELAVMTPKFAVAETPIADCVLLRKAMIALGLIARFQKAPEELADKLQEIMDDLLFKLIKVEHETEAAIGMKVEAMSLLTRFIEAFEEEALPFIDDFLTFINVSFNKYTALLIAGNVAEQTTMVYNDLVAAASSFILTLFQLDLQRLVNFAPSYFPAACKLVNLVTDEPLKGELIELVGNTGLLSLRSAADPENLDDSDDEDDDMDEEGMDEEDEESNNKLDFLDKKMMSHDPSTVPVYTIGAEVPFELLQSVATEAASLYTKYVDSGAEHLLGTAPLMGILVGVAAGYYTPEQQNQMLDIVFPVVFNALKAASSNLPKAKAILSTLREIIKFATQASLASKFDEIYETLQAMHHAAKDTLKAKTGGKKAGAKAKYAKFRQAVLKCFGRLMQKDPVSLVAHADKFMKETAPLFADPGLLAEFVTALYSVNDDAVKAAVKDTHLPKVMTQLTNEIKKTTISATIRSTILLNSSIQSSTGGQGIDLTRGMINQGPISVWYNNLSRSASILGALGKIGNKCGPIFDTYVEDVLPHFFTYLETDFAASAETINSLAEIVEGLKTSPSVLAKVVPRVCTAVSGVLTKGLKENSEFTGFGAQAGAENVEEEDEEDEEDDMYDEEDDLNTLILYKALCALTYFVRTPELAEQVNATVPADQQLAIFDQVFADAAKEGFFDEDPALKIPEIELLTDMVEKLPALRTQANKTKLLEAFQKIPIDFEELQNATEKLEALKLE